MAGANLATPLYAVYAHRFGFSSLVLTTIFATYAAVLVPALVLFGRLSDRVGRRPVVVGGLVVAAGGLALFCFADGPVWLYAARAVQGLAVGMISGAATAALVELDPDGDRRRAALFAGLAQAGGSATGPLVAGVLAQWAPDPLRLCYLVGIGGAVAAVTLTLPAAGGGGERWRPQWPHVPREIRGGFARVSLTAAVAWASVALYLSIVPSYAAQLSTTHDVALLAAIAALALLSSCVAQIVAPRHTQGAGLVVLGVGLLGLVLAAPAHSLVVLVVGSVLAGAGHGAAFLDAQQDMNEIAPEGTRGEITSAFIAAIYAAVACAVVGTGLLDLVFSLQTAVAAVASALLVLSAAAAALAFGAWPRARASGSWPRSQRSRQERRPSRSRRSASTARPARSR